MGAAGLTLVEAEQEPQIPSMPELGARRAEGLRGPAAGGGRSGLRPHRVLLRAGHRGRSPRRARLRRCPPGISAVCAAAPGPPTGAARASTAARPSRPGSRRDEGMSRTVLPVDALVVGAGPAGLAAATALKAGGVGRVVVVDREDEAGGHARLCEHTGFGLRDLRRVLSGPAYARRWVERAVAGGVDIRTRSMVTGWAASGRAEVTGPARVARSGRACRRAGHRRPGAPAGRPPGPGDTALGDLHDRPAPAVGAPPASAPRRAGARRRVPSTSPTRPC